MGACPKCKSPVAPGSKSCAACGQLMPAIADGTLEAGEYFNTAAPQNESQPKVDSTKASAEDAAKANSQSPSPTPIKPVAAADSAKGTLGAPEILEQPKKKTPEPKPGSTVDINYDVATDANATVDLPGASEAAQGSGTVEYGDAELKVAKTGKGDSGTAGRLKRLWEGLAGSTGNPLQTLKGSDAMASDSVFAQVSPRILVTDAAIEIVDRVGSPSASQPDRKARVEECISVACRGSDSQQADYNLTGFLGQGAMGVVLKAHQKAIGRDVAIKMIQPSSGLNASSTNAQKKKFFYEAQITGKLDHPNIVPVYELGVSNGILFYSMKLIVGQEWKSNIQTNTRDENLEILMKVCDAMAFAHQRQVIHRDLKPENVMLGSFGEVLVTDWGCAVDLSRREKFTGAGSAPWMAPEMADHSVSKIGPRSDIYLLGAMLYQIIAGHAPHPGQTVFECLAAAQKNIIIPLDTDDPLLDIALRAMETEPEDRFPTVESMQAAIREYRRHAESIMLTERSEAMLVQAKDTKDYERFSRSVFGFQEAIELWSGNTAAHTGLREARLAYGQCAFSKGDFDFCLQSLNQKVPAEAALYAEAAKAKKTVEERGRRLKTLSMAFVAAVLLGFVGSSIFGGIAWQQKGIADAKTLEAVEQRDDAEMKSIIAGIEEAYASRQKKFADEKADEAVRQREVAENEKSAAEVSAIIAEIEQSIAGRQQKLAEINKEEAVAQTKVAKAQTIVAEARTAEVELGNFRSNLAASLAKVQQQNIAGADLKSLTDDSSYEALTKQGKVPKFDNWSVKRIKILSNEELLGATLGGNVSAVAFAQNANVGIVATKSAGKGHLQVVRLEGKELKVIQSRATASTVGSVAISPNGDEVVYSLSSDTDQGLLYTWSLTAGSEPAEVAKNGRRNLQGLVMTSNKVLGGINGGLWIWDRSPNWSESEPKKIDDVRGRLESLQLLDDSSALVLAEFKNKLRAHIVDLKKSKSQEILFDLGTSEFKDEVLSAAAFSQNLLVIGTNSGKVFTVDMTPASTKVGPEFRQLPQKHQSRIKSIVVHPDGTLLTTAYEPVVQVWKPSATELAGWKHDTFLVGTPDNVGGVAFMKSSNLVLGAGSEKGQPIVWDVQRQKQRQRMEVIGVAGKPLDYKSPVIEVVTSVAGNRAVSIHADGGIDSWDLVTGKSISESNTAGDQLVRVGHTPGATFVDMAVAAEAGVMVTSALLPEKEEVETTDNSKKDGRNKQKETKNRVWEFCKWNLNDGKMLDRWTRESETEQQISLLKSGELILYASNTETIIAEARRDGAIRFNEKDLGSFFAVENPNQKNISMQVKRSGAVRIFDLNKTNGGLESPGQRLNYDDDFNEKLLSFDDYPLVGEWSPKGDRFYMVWTSGRITELQWEGGRLSAGRDLQNDELTKLNISLKSTNKGDLSTDGKEKKEKREGGLRLASRYQLDMKVRDQAETHLVYLAIRFPGVDGRTRLVRVAFPPEGKGEVLASKREDALQRHGFILTDATDPAVDVRPFKRLPKMSGEIVATRTVGDTSFCATADGTVYRISENNPIKVFGRPAALAGSGNLTADRIVTLHLGGVLWRGDLKNSTWEWTQLESVSAGANDLKMSPDGKQMLLRISSEIGERSLVLADAETGKIVETIDQAQCGVWSSEGELAIVRGDGTVEVRGAGGAKVIGNAGTNATVRSIHFFTEPWKDGNTTRWLAVHSQPSEGEGKLSYFQLDGGNNEDRSMSLADGVSVLACSPKDGILVTGSAGVVGIHFASPNLKEYGKLLFTLEGHAGAEIKSLKFSQDGSTLITTDDRGRLFGWLSHDPLSGISDVPDFGNNAQTIQ